MARARWHGRGGPGAASGDGLLRDGVLGPDPERAGPAASQHDPLVTDVQPGFVDTEMSRATATRPFLWTAERAASHIVEELRSAPAVVAFPRPLGAAITASRALPDGWVSYLAGKGVGKPR